MEIILTILKFIAVAGLIILALGLATLVSLVFFMVIKFLAEFTRKDKDETHDFGTFGVWGLPKDKCICELNSEGNQIKGWCEKHHTDWL